MIPLASLRLAGLALLGSALASFAAPADWVGKPLPALPVKYLDAKPELKGKPAVVEFWATWCPPCRKSIPHLNELNAKYKAKGLNIIGISDEKQDVVDSFRKTLPMEYTVALDDGGKLGEKFGITGIPQAFIVDKDGKIVWQGHPMELKEETIEKVLK
jgi:thiol-disulfide isomerase/thioredoxin